MTGVRGTEAKEAVVLADPGERTGVCRGGKGKEAIVNGSGLADRERGL